MNKPEDKLDELLQELCNTVFQHGQATRTNTPFHYGEPMKEAKAAILSIINEAKEELLKDAHKAVDDTIIVLTNDLPSLLNQEEVYQIRKQHKKEIHANLDQLNTMKGKGI